MQQFQQIIEEAWENRASLQPGTAPAKVGEAVAKVLAELDAGTLRVAEKIGTDWVTHQWIKKAVLLSFRLEDNVVLDNGPMRYFDKVPTKFVDYDTEKFKRGGFRVVPPASWKELDAACRARGMVLGGNYGCLADKVFRVGHMGSQADEALVTRGMALLKEVLKSI